MIATLIFVTIGILFIVVPRLLTRARRAGERVAEEDRFDSFSNGQFQKLGDRIFDSGDFRWLRDTVGRADLARQLRRTRRGLAMRWLRSLRRSFDEVVRTPEPDSQSSPGNNALASWRIVWLTVRFQSLIAYALLVVGIFGPYQRLLPSLRWLQLPRPASPKARYEVAR